MVHGDHQQRVAVVKLQQQRADQRPAPEIERPQRLAVALQATLTTAEASSLDTKTLFALEQDLLNLADAIGSHYFPHGPNASRPEKLTGLA